MKRQLENTVFEVESPKGLVKIMMNGAQEIKDIKINANLKETEARVLEDAIKEALARAIKQSQVVAAEKMKSITGFNLPGVT